MKSSQLLADKDSHFETVRSRGLHSPFLLITFRKITRAHKLVREQSATDKSRSHLGSHSIELLTSFQALLSSGFNYSPKITYILITLCHSRPQSAERLEDVIVAHAECQAVQRILNTMRSLVVFTSLSQQFSLA